MRSRFTLLLFMLILVFGTKTWAAGLGHSRTSSSGGTVVTLSGRDGGSSGSGGGSGSGSGGGGSDDGGGDDHGGQSGGDDDPAGDDNGGIGGDDDPAGDDHGDDAGMNDDDGAGEDAGDDNGVDDGADDHGGDNGADDQGEDAGDDDNAGDDAGQHGGAGGGAGVFKFDQRGFLALESSKVAIITIERSKGDHGAVSVEFSTGNGTATAGPDYDAVTTVLSWADGDESTKSVMVPIADDGVDETNETVDLLLDSPTGGATVDAERGTAVLTILDHGSAPGNDDADEDHPEAGDDRRAGTVKFDEGSFEVIESAGMVTIRVERSHGEHGAITVDYPTSDASAEDGSDYTHTAGTLAWADGDESDKTFTVPILEDDDAEGSETFNLTLSNPTGGAVIDPDRGASMVQILDNDGATAACVPGPNTLCLAHDRFKVETTFRSERSGAGQANAVGLSQDSGLFWFFQPSNTEMLVKVLDACALPAFHSYWVFFAATTNVDFTVRVTDTKTGLTRDYGNLLGRAAEPIQDTATFKTCQ